MRTIFLSVLLFAGSWQSCTAGIVTVDLDGTGSGTFLGLGTTSATYTETVQVENVNTGMFDDYDLVLTLTGSGAITAGATGLGIGDAFIDDGETLEFQFSLTPSPGTLSNLQSFEFTEMGHGVTISSFPTSFVSVSDGSSTNILANGITGPSDISNLNGQTITVATSTFPFQPGSVEGISSISFDTTSAPEPSSAILCGFFLCGLGFRRRRAKGRV